MKTKKNFSEMISPNWIMVISLVIFSIISLGINAQTVIAPCTASGYVNVSGAGGLGNMIDISANSAPSGYNRGWASFAIPTLPLNSVVTKVTIQFSVLGINPVLSPSLAWNNLYFVQGSTALSSGLYAACGGTGANANAIATSAWSPTGTQSTELFCSGADYVQNNQGSNVNIGFVREPSSTTIYDLYGFGSANPPQLIIEYLINSPLCVGLNNSGSSIVNSCDSYVWNGVVYQVSGEYCHHFTNYLGCDSVHHLNLNITPTPSSPPNAITSITECDTYTWSCNGQTYTTSGTYTCSYLLPSGCLGADVLDLTINPSNSFTNPIDIGQVPCLDAPYINTQINSTANCFSNSYVGFVGSSATNQPSPDIWYKFTLAKDATVRISTCASVLDDTYLHLLNSSGDHIYASDDYSTPYSTLCDNFSDYYKGSLLYPLSAGTYYITVEGWGNDVGSITTSISLSFQDCYCSSKASSTQNEEIYKVTLNAGTIFEGSTNTTYVNGCNVVAPGPGSLLNRYSNFNHPSIGILSTLLPGVPTQFIIEENECDGSQYYAFGTAIWIDYNRDGDFDDADEKVFVENVSAIGPRNVISSFTVPTNVTCGPAIMRITVAEGYAGAALTPCLQYGYGETEDHIINIGEPPFTQLTTALCSYTWTCNNTTYTASGIYTCTNMNANGCVQTTILNLTVNYPSPIISNVNHYGNSYTWNGNTYTASGTYTYTYAPCYIQILNLTIQSAALSLNIVEDQPISCHGSNNGAVQAIASLGGTYSYTISNPTLPSVTNSTGYFINLEPGVHTICATSNTPPFASECSQITLNEPSPLSANVITDVIPTCGGSNGALSAIISGGVSIQPYLTYWFDASNNLLNTTGYFDQSIAGLSAGTYTLIVEDDHGCTATTSINLVSEPCNVIINVKCFIEGYWDGTSSMVPALANQGVTSSTNACDNITVELHEANVPYGMVHTTTAILNQDGTASCDFGTSVTNGSYYIVVKHRNALQTWSANPVLIGTTTSYDFSTEASKAYGANQVQIALGVWAFYSGDVELDENMDLLDLSLVETDVNNFGFGYLATDINGDGNVDLLDTPILQNNIDNFRFSAHP